MENLCFALLLVLVLVVICKAYGRPMGMSAPPAPYAPPKIMAPLPMTAEVASNVIRPPVNGPAIGPMKEVAQSHMGGAETDDPESGRFAYVGLGGMSCPNKRWYDSVYNGGTYTEVDEPGVAWRDVNWETSDLMPMGPYNPDASHAFPEPVVQRDLRSI